MHKAALHVGLLLLVFGLVVGLVKIFPVLALDPVVTGQVTNPDGSAAANVQVGLHLPDGTVSFSATTDASGSYSFSTSLTPGATWVLEVSAPAGYNKPTNSPTNFTYQTGDATRTVNFVLQSAPKTVSGHVTNEDGSPVTDADVDAYPSDASGGRSKVSARTTNDGSYSMALLPGAWYINAVANLSEQGIRWLSNAGPVELAFTGTTESETKTQDFVVTPATGNLRVTLLNSDGAKLTSSNFVADIDVRRVDGIGTVRKVLQADSSLNIFLTPGIYHICGYHPDLSNKSFDPAKTTFVMTENGMVDLGTITAETNTAHLKGTVVDGSGRGLSNINLQAFSENGCDRPTTNTDQKRCL